MRVFGDVLKPETLQQANETIKAEFGAVDILINAAGGNHPSATTNLICPFSICHSMHFVMLVI